MSKNATTLDNRFSFTVERCIDSPEWVWTLYCDDQDMADGYEATRQEAARKALQAYREFVEQLS
jgi:hypothetical protein